MTQKSILITGCSSGIGLNAANGLRAAGWRVFAACRKKDDCDKLREMGFESPLIDYDDTSTIHRGLAEVLSAIVVKGIESAASGAQDFGQPAVDR